MITAIPFNQSDAARAERLLDLIYWYNQNPNGHCLLVQANDVHPEMELKIKISAEVAFRSVDVIKAPPMANQSKTRCINLMFQTAATYVKDCYNQPWLWLEADCLPLRKTWLTNLTDHYVSQPRRYLGRFMQAQAGRFLNRVAVYPPDAITDLDQHCQGQVPFERVAGIIDRCSSSQIFHNVKYGPGVTTPDTAIIFNGDRTGELVERLMESTVEVVEKPQLATVVKRGRPPKVKL